jgi:hypothetical protein
MSGRNAMSSWLRWKENRIAYAEKDQRYNDQCVEKDMRGMKNKSKIIKESCPQKIGAGIIVDEQCERRQGLERGVSKHKKY